MTTKKTCILLLAMLINCSIFGQDVAAVGRKLQIGFRVSPNVTWAKIKSGPAERSGTGLGFSYGLEANYKFGPNYFLCIEALVTSMKNSIALKDSFYQGDGTVGSYYNDVKQAYKFQYVQVPLTMKMKTNTINGTRYFFQAGLAPSVLISRNVKVSADKPLPTDGEWFSPNASDRDAGDFQLDPNNSNTKAFDNKIGIFRVPLVLGAGIEYDLSGNTAFTAGIRWDNGFTDIFRDKNTVGINNYLGLSLGILF